LGEHCHRSGYRLNFPARFGGSTSGLPVVQDFLYGIIPLVMMVFAIQEWRRRRSESKQKENPTMAYTSVLRRP